MNTDPDLTTANAGRPINLTPVPGGLWMVIGGGVVASLGPRSCANVRCSRPSARSSASSSAR